MRGLEARSGALGGLGSRLSGASSDGTRARSSGGSRLSACFHATVTTESLALASSLREILLGRGGHRRQGIVVDIPVGGVLLGALVGTAGLVVVSVAAGRLGLGERLLERIIVGQLFHIVSLDLDQTVLARLLGVFIDQTTRVDTSHVRGVEGPDFLELALVGVAAVLGQEEGKSVSGEVLDLLVPSRGLERGWITPGVVVEGEEVAALVIGTTVHVLGHFQTVGVNVGLALN